MRRNKIMISLGAMTITVAAILLGIKISVNSTDKKIAASYSGSESCIPCHQKFYDLWANSKHGLAMQPVTPEILESLAGGTRERIRVGNGFFSVSHKNDSLIYTEWGSDGAVGHYTAEHLMGGKYVYYFLTNIEKGKLQILPLAYDIGTSTWYNNPESGVRHFEEVEDSPLDWRSHLYTFNTTCYSCHVSQVTTNFNFDSLTYNTSWREPGINCETCHGPSAEHIRACVKAGEGEIPSDLKIVVTSGFSPEQHNSSCGSCHGKGSSVAGRFVPGGKYYDYFNLVTLEDPDFYPDGRDLGENYTMTGWEMNRCALNSDINCVTCHTSSGRYRYANENFNDACLPCHSDKVARPETHTFHKSGTEASRCISCHMPKTEFARMERSDHSFRPPMPKATIAFGSPNACNICHNDKSPEWSQRSIEINHRREYQESTIRAGLLIKQARKGNWESLEEITSGLLAGEFDPVFRTSFLRLLENCEESSKWNAIVQLTEDKSPLVRSAAVHSLAYNFSNEAYRRLLELTGDESRLVRINAGYALATYPEDYINPGDSARVHKAILEYVGSLTGRPDDWSSYYNLGNFYVNRGEYKSALKYYSDALRLYPGAVMPLVNSGYIYSITGNIAFAEKAFQEALASSPDHPAALLNLALLYGEQGRMAEAEAYFRRLLVVSPRNSVAAYNLGVIISDNDPGEALKYSEMAAEWSPEDPKYLYTYCYFLYHQDEVDKALKELKKLIGIKPIYPDGYFLYATICRERGDEKKVEELMDMLLQDKNCADDTKEAARRFKER